MFNKICGWVINGATAVMMAGFAALTVIAVKETVTDNKKITCKKEDK